MLDTHSQRIRELLRRVRRRCRTLSTFHATIRAALAASGVIGAALLMMRLGHWAERSPLALALVASTALLLAIAAILWGPAPLRDAPSDVRLARFIEEREPSLEDRLATAVDLVQSDRAASSPALIEPLLADAARRAEALDIDTVVAGEQLRRRGFQAAAAVLVLLALIFAAREPTRRAVDAGALAVLPERVRLAAAPGGA